jgi:rhomboid protease GluP
VRVEAAAPPTVAARPRARGPVATRALTFALLAVAAAIELMLGDSSDPAVLLRSGALVRGFVHAGEYWRLVTAIFIHVGGVHLILNVIGLWFLGRLAEELFGGWRTAALFGLSGLAGTCASYLASPAGLSAGASGAILGLLGAVFVELTLHRRRHRTAWNRGVWGSLLVVAIAEVGLGFVYSMIDQWAHVGGLAAGVVVGALLSPNTSWAKAGLHSARAITIAFAAAVVIAGVLVVRTSLADSLDRTPRERRTIGDVAVTVPASWRVEDGAAFDADLPLILEPRYRTGALDSVLIAATDEATEDAHKHYDQVDTAGDAAVLLPAEWRGKELVVSSDASGGRLRSRYVLAVRPEGDRVLLAKLLVPESLARAAPSFFTALFASIVAQGQ